MPERFVPLRETVRRGAFGEPRGDVPRRAERVAEAPQPLAPFASLESDIAVLRVAAREAFERRAHALLASLARDVLARELAIAPCDLETLIARAMHEYERFEPLAIVLSPDASARVRCALPVRADAALGDGDVTIVVRDGAFESRFAYRAERSVASVCATGSATAAATA